MIELTTTAPTGFVTMKLPVEIIAYIDKKTSERLESSASWIRAAVIDRIEAERASKRPVTQTDEVA